MNKNESFYKVDLKILQQLDDKELPLVCSVNKYVAELCNDENFWLTRLINKQVYPLEEIRDFKGNFTYKEIYRHLFLNEYEQGMFEAAKRNNVYYYNVVSRGHFNLGRTVKSFQHAVKNNSFDILTSILLNKESKKIDMEYEIYYSGNEKVVKWYIHMGMGSYSDYIAALVGYRVEFSDYVYEQLRKYLPYIKYNISDFEELGFRLGEAIFGYAEDEEIELLHKLEKMLDLFLQHVRKEDKANFIKHVRLGTENRMEDVNETFLKMWKKFLQEKQ